MGGMGGKRREGGRRWEGRERERKGGREREIKRERDLKGCLHQNFKRLSLGRGTLGFYFQFCILNLFIYSPLTETTFPKSIQLQESNVPLGVPLRTPSSGWCPPSSAMEGCGQRTGPVSPLGQSPVSPQSPLGQARPCKRLFSEQRRELLLTLRMVQGG